MAGGGKGRLGRGQNVISILLNYENLKVLTVKANKQIQSMRSGWNLVEG